VETSVTTTASGGSFFDPLFYWKAAGVFLSLIVGMVALTGDFRDKQTRRLTIPGWINAGLLIVGFAVGVVAEGVDSHNKLLDSRKTQGILLQQSDKLKEANDELAKQDESLTSIVRNDQTVLQNSTVAVSQEAKLLTEGQATLHQVDRSMNLIRDVRIAWTYQVPVDAAPFSTFGKVLDAQANKIFLSPGGTTECGQLARDVNDVPIYVLFSTACTEVTQGVAKLIYTVIQSSGALLEFYDGEIPSRFKPADLTFSAEPPSPFQPDGTFDKALQTFHMPAWILYDFRAKKVLFSQEGVAKMGDRNSGRFTSIPDLCKAHLKLTITDHFYGTEDERMKQKAARAVLQPRSIILQIGGQTFIIKGTMFTPIDPDKDEFAAVLPGSMDQLRPQSSPRLPKNTR
jgi:hypothetical protein